jgi:adenosylmethionine-8-amino-7-oxononanoate aminotransferase
MKLHEDRLPVAIARAQGPWLYGADGTRYLDGISSWWVNLLGHSHPHIKAALAHQIEQLDHVMLAGFTHEPVVELSEKLSQLTGLGHAFYGSDGASATEIALKMSAHYWRNVGRPAKSQFVGRRWLSRRDRRCARRDRHCDLSRSVRAARAFGCRRP